MGNKIDDLQQLRIHELRDLARKMGVSAPTLLKKEQIIEEIMKIMNGELPAQKTSKKGRPVRLESENFNFVQFLLPNQEEIVEQNEAYPMQRDTFCLMLNMLPASYEGITADDSEEYKGIVELKPEGFGLIHVAGLTYSTHDLFISIFQAKSENLKTGEEVSAKKHFLKENYPELAVDIKRINDKIEDNFDDMPTKNLGEKLKTTTMLKNVQLGGRYFVKSDNQYEDVVKLANDIMKNNPQVKVETLFLNAMVEKIPYDLNAHMYNIPFNKSDEDVASGVKVYFERLKRLAENGNHMVVVVNEISKVARAINNLYLKNNSYSELSNMTAHKMQDIIASAKNIGRGSITLICVDPLKVPTNIENLFNFEILPLFA